MEENREWGPTINGGQRKRSQAKESTTELMYNLRGTCEGTHTMEDMRHLVCNENTRDLKKNRKKKRVKEWPVVVDTCWGYGIGF